MEMEKQYNELIQALACRSQLGNGITSSSVEESSGGATASVTALAVALASVASREESLMASSFHLQHPPREWANPCTVRRSTRPVVGRRKIQKVARLSSRKRGASGPSTHLQLNNSYIAPESIFLVLAGKQNEKSVSQYPVVIPKPDSDRVEPWSDFAKSTEILRESSSSTTGL